MMKKIAWIGTGVMGRPMALHLQKGGYEVSVYNRTFAKAQAMEPQVKACQTIESVVSDADVVFTIVGYPKDVQEVYQEIMKYAKEGAILVDMTTSSPTLAVKIYEEGRAKGFKVIDAPVTGGDLGAINGTLSIMVGGDAQDYETILPLLNLLGTTITYMGKAGSGQNAKLANQIAIASSLAGTAEALTFAKAKGLNLDAMLNVITGGSANSWQASNNGPKMLVEDWSPGFFAKHLLKDLNLAVEEKQDLELPLVEGVTKLYQLLIDEGYGDLGTQVILKHYLKQLQ